MKAGGPYVELARLLEALASPTRLEILHRLRTPQTVSGIRVAPSVSREGERPERALARQTVTHHLEHLLAHGLVQKVDTDEGHGEAYVLDHQSLFALVDDLRHLAKLRPVLPSPGDDAETVTRPLDRRASIPPAPRLVVAYGREDGEAFPLHGPAGSRWRIGRGAGCEVRLDYDRQASAVHAAIERTEAGFTLRDEGSRNGTWIDWEPLPRGRVAPLRPGTLVTVGRSILAFQA